jgi:hypothetical protein
MAWPLLAVAIESRSKGERVVGSSKSLIDEEARLTRDPARIKIGPAEARGPKGRLRKA